MFCRANAPAGAETDGAVVDPRYVGDSAPTVKPRPRRAFVTRPLPPRTAFVDLRFPGVHFLANDTVTIGGVIADRFKGDLLNAAYASDLMKTIQSALWVHGYTHDSYEHCVGGSRIACNPRGYGDENGRFEPGKLGGISTLGLGVGESLKTDPS